MDLHPETPLAGSKIPSNLLESTLETFKAHSCRAAATSKADSKGLPLKHILIIIIIILMKPVV